MYSRGFLLHFPSGLSSSLPANLHSQINQRGAYKTQQDNSVDSVSEQKTKNRQISHFIEIKPSQVRNPQIRRECYHCHFCYRERSDEHDGTVKNQRVQVSFVYFKRMNRQYVWNSNPINYVTLDQAYQHVNYHHSIKNRGQESAFA